MPRRCPQPRRPQGSYLPDRDTVPWPRGSACPGCLPAPRPPCTTPATLAASSTPAPSCRPQGLGTCSRSAPGTPPKPAFPSVRLRQTWDPKNGDSHQVACSALPPGSRQGLSLLLCGGRNILKGCLPACVEVSGPHPHSYGKPGPLTAWRYLERTVGGGGDSILRVGPRDGTR